MRARQQTVIVFDPVGTSTAGGGWGDGAFVFDDEEEFLELMHDERVQRAHVFVDEADIIFNHARKENFWMVTRGRHFGLSVNLLTQRPMLVHPTVRGQCPRLYMFRLGKSDRSELGQERAFDDFGAIDLDAGEFVVADSAQRDYKRLNVFQLLKG